MKNVFNKCNILGHSDSPFYSLLENSFTIFQIIMEWLNDDKWWSRRHINYKFTGLWAIRMIFLVFDYEFFPSSLWAALILASIFFGSERLLKNGCCNNSNAVARFSTSTWNPKLRFNRFCSFIFHHLHTSKHLSKKFCKSDDNLSHDAISGFP